MRNVTFAPGSRQERRRRRIENIVTALILAGLSAWTVWEILSVIAGEAV